MKYKLVDLAKHGFVIEPRYWFWGWTDTPVVFGRASLAAMLVKARRALPAGYNFKVWDCQRPLKVQLKMIASFKRRFIAANPRMKPTELEKLLYTFASRPKRVITRLDHHRHGGAIDLTIVDAQGRELWMGTDHDDLSPVAALDFFEKHPPRRAMDREARKNRRLLKKAMLSAGFGMYAPEWWHWDTTK